MVESKKLGEKRFRRTFWYTGWIGEVSYLSISCLTTWYINCIILAQNKYVHILSDVSEEQWRKPCTILPSLGSMFFRTSTSLTCPHRPVWGEQDTSPIEISRSSKAAQVEQLPPKLVGRQWTWQVELASKRRGGTIWKEHRNIQNIRKASTWTCSKDWPWTHSAILVSKLVASASKSSAKIGHGMSWPIPQQFTNLKLPSAPPRLAPRRKNGSTKKQQRNNPSNADSETFRTAPKIFGRQQCAINGAGQQEGTSGQ